MKTKKLFFYLALPLCIAVMAMSVLTIDVYASPANPYYDYFVGLGALTGQELKDASNNKTVATDANGYFVFTDNGIPVMTGDPQITVLTPGLGGQAADWSNGLSENSSTAWQLQYDKESIIGQIDKRTGGAKKYWAKLFSNSSMEIVDLNRQAIDQPYDPFGQTLLSIDDVSKHIILLFEPSSSLDGINNTYAEFDYMMDKVVNDVKIMNGGVLPKVNLIGHSRGGNINLMYAMEHPDLVETLASVGTPYFGFNTAQLFGKNFADGPGL